jgi:hypothetical protein
MERLAKLDFPLHMYSESKVFVTGVYGSGKTLFALRYASAFKVKYIDFDKYYDYRKIEQTNVALEFMNVLSDNFITDAIPAHFNFGIGYEDFLAYTAANKVRVVCLVCPDIDEWKKRARLGIRKLPLYQAFVDYAKFYFSILPLLRHLPIDYIDTYANQHITLDELYERISWIKPLLNFI